MATQTIVFQCPVTPDAVHVRNLATTTEVSGASITELDDGLYSATFSSLSGDYTLSALLSSSLRAVGSVFNVTDTAATFYESDLVDPASLIPTTSEIFAAVLTSQLTEAYAADGTAPTLAQAIFLIQQSLHEFAISGTTRTVKKLDGSTTAATFTLNDATNPTSTTRAS